MDKVQKDDPNRVRSAGEAGVEKLRKKPYSRPVLQVYGSVSKLTMGTSGSVADGAVMTQMAMCDRNAKQDIVRIGDHPLGIGLYMFEYRREFRDRWGHGRQFGVMADEVARTLPSAVAVDAQGFSIVDYGMLGINRAPQ